MPLDLLHAVLLLGNYVIVPGLAYAAQLALGALGITLVFGILRFANLAHGDIMAFGTMAAVLGTWQLQAWNVTIAPLPTALLALPLAVAAAIAVTLAADRTVFRYYRRKRSAPIVLVMASLGVMFVLNGVVRFIIGPNDRRFTDGERFLIKRPRIQALHRPCRRPVDQDHAVPEPGHRHRGRRRPVLVPAEDADRQVDAGLFRQRGSRAAVGHQP